MLHPARDAAVIRQTADSIDRLHAKGIEYAGLFAPLHDEGLADTLRRSTVLLRLEPLAEGVMELVTPPMFGLYVMTVSSTLTYDRRRFATRHGLGHVVAGHVSELSFLSASRDHTTLEERVADTFALADVVPWWRLDELRRGRASVGQVKQLLCRVLRQNTVGWPEARVIDRANLRMRLYWECKL